MSDKVKLYVNLKEQLDVLRRQKREDTEEFDNINNQIQKIGSTLSHKEKFETNSYNYRNNR